MLIPNRLIHEDRTVGKIINMWSGGELILLCSTIQVDKLEFTDVLPSEASNCELPAVFLSDHNPSLMRMDNNGGMFMKAASFFYAGDYSITNYVVAKDNERLRRDGVNDQRFIANMPNHPEWFDKHIDHVVTPRDDVTTMFIHSGHFYTGWLDNYTARAADWLRKPNISYYPTEHGDHIKLMYISEVWFNPGTFDDFIHDKTLEKFSHWKWVETGHTDVMGCKHFGSWSDGHVFGATHPVHVPAENRTLVIGSGRPDNIEKLQHRIFDFFRDPYYYRFNRDHLNGDKFTNEMVDDLSWYCGEELVHHHSSRPHKVSHVDSDLGVNVIDRLNTWVEYKRPSCPYEYPRYHPASYATLGEGINKFILNNYQYEIFDINRLVTNVIRGIDYLKPNEAFYSYNKDHSKRYSQISYGEEGMPGWYRVQIPAAGFNEGDGGFWLDFGSDLFWTGILDTSKVPTGQQILLEVRHSGSKSYFNLIIVSYDEHHIMESFLIVQNAYIMDQTIYKKAMNGCHNGSFVRVFGGRQTKGESVRLTDLSSNQITVKFIDTIRNEFDDKGMTIYDKTTDTASTDGDISGDKSLIAKLKKQLADAKTQIDDLKSTKLDKMVKSSEPEKGSNSSKDVSGSTTVVTSVAEVTTKYGSNDTDSNHSVSSSVADKLRSLMLRKMKSTPTKMDMAHTSPSDSISSEVPTGSIASTPSRYQPKYSESSEVSNSSGYDKLTTSSERGDQSRHGSVNEPNVISNDSNPTMLSALTLGLLAIGAVAISMTNIDQNKEK